MYYISAHWAWIRHRSPLHFNMPYAIEVLLLSEILLELGPMGVPLNIVPSIQVNFHFTRGNSTCVPNIGRNGNIYMIILSHLCNGTGISKCNLPTSTGISNLMMLLK